LIEQDVLQDSKTETVKTRHKYSERSRKNKAGNCHQVMVPIYLCQRSKAIKGPAGISAFVDSWTRYSFRFVSADIWHDYVHLSPVCWWRRPFQVTARTDAIYMPCRGCTGRNW